MPDAAQAPDTRYLYTLTPSYLGDSTIALINRRLAGIFSSAVSEESERSALAVLDDHLHMGATTGLNDPVDHFIGQKLQSLWTQRQMIKGDGGNTYLLENGNLTIRTSNVFLHGNFRGLLIQIEADEKVAGGDTDAREVFERVRTKYGIPEGEMFCGVLDESNKDMHGDLCFQYSKVLDF